MGSPPKPWERNGTIAAAAAASTSAPAASTSSPAPAAPNTTSTSTNTVSSSSTTPPSVPARPASFASPAASTMASPFASPSLPLQSLRGRIHLRALWFLPIRRHGHVRRVRRRVRVWHERHERHVPGAYGGGMGMYGGGQPGMPFDPSNPSVTQALESTTATTFALLHSVVQTFAGLAQMLESTFMATHSSFFALAGVIDQFAQLRNALGSVLGLFGLIRWLRDVLTGRRASGNNAEMRSEFRHFLNGRPVQGPAAGPSQPAPPPNASKKPLIFFFIAFLGIPYAMHKLQGQQALPPLDPSQLAFARTVFPFKASTQSELTLQENEIVAVMGKLDPSTGMEIDPRLEVQTEWWKGRTREGREGWFPRNYVEVLERKAPAPEAKKVD
ncbi:Peroxin 13, N-terminal region-domain-containing protein [Russula vinacea]|nr:Peroxin 13, N-terminal region-domain-containing protein [Russula vinacea]